METGRVRKLRKLNGLEIYEYVAPKLGVIPGRPEGPGPESIITLFGCLKRCHPISFYTGNASGRGLTCIFRCIIQYQVAPFSLAVLLTSKQRGTP